MIYMQRPLTQAEVNMFLSAFQNMHVKAEFAKQVRMQIDQRSNQYGGKVQSYDALIAGDVNMQNRLAASGYDIYGRTVIASNRTVFNNNNIYKRIKTSCGTGLETHLTLVTRTVATSP